MESDAVVPESQIEGNDAAIYAAIAGLSKNQKGVFIMIAIEEMSSKEAAEALGIAESTLRVHLARAKENLRSALKGILNDD